MGFHHTAIIAANEDFYSCIFLSDTSRLVANGIIIGWIGYTRCSPCGYSFPLSLERLKPQVPYRNAFVN